ncbi:P-loop containing nucleoside triphosphate hydrolase protein [Agrocybe pediades]|nr:P-loop containing nucleoside triphosphate hydrolase protein [Agrocybe pediades]
MTPAVETRKEPIFKFESPEGRNLCRKILEQRLPYGPHDFQLDGITAVLDGFDLLAISATGPGKSAYIYMLLHVILGLLDSPTLCPTAKFPKDPAVLVVYPTTALEEDQEKKMGRLGIKAKAINAMTKMVAAQQAINIWSSVESTTNVILVSPEMLSTRGFANLIESKTFQSRLVAIVVDEVHLLTSWGENFRPAFRQIGYIRKRFSQKVPTIAMTATLQDKNRSAICSQLGFREGTYRLVHRSNSRPDIQLFSHSNFLAGYVNFIVAG